MSLRTRSNVGSNTPYVYRVITPSAICPFNCRLCPLKGIKGSAETTLYEWNLRY